MEPKDSQAEVSLKGVGSRRDHMVKHIKSQRFPEMFAVKLGAVEVGAFKKLSCRLRILEQPKSKY